jgi:hypothetical protein
MPRLFAKAQELGPESEGDQQAMITAQACCKHSAAINGSSTASKPMLSKQRPHSKNFASS